MIIRTSHGNYIHSEHFCEFRVGEEMTDDDNGTGKFVVCAAEAYTETDYILFESYDKDECKQLLIDMMEALALGKPVYVLPEAIEEKTSL